MRRWEYVAGVLAEVFKDRERIRGAELGVKEGKFSEHLLARFGNLTMIVVDLWAPQPGNDKKPGGESYENWDNEAIEAEARKRLAPFGDRAEIHKCYTSDELLLKGVPDQSLDFVFIDADHSYEGVSGDITLWQPKVKPGGIVFGHDYNHNWPGVQRAVADHFPLHRVEVGTDSVWWVVVE